MGMPAWLQNIPDNYTAQLAIMGWFLTLTSKMTGYTIPGVGVAPGGTIEKPRGAVDHFLKDMETLADAMAVQKNWDRPQYAILKEMYLDLKRMHYSFRVNRDQTTGKFRPMSEVDGPKLPSHKSVKISKANTKKRLLLISTMTEILHQKSNTFEDKKLANQLAKIYKDLNKMVVDF